MSINWQSAGEYEDILAWLDEDDDDEESFDYIGTDVVIGRTHMFSGEKRIYPGMPAYSTAEDADGSFTMAKMFGGNFEV